MSLFLCAISSNSMIDDEEEELPAELPLPGRLPTLLYGKENARLVVCKLCDADFGATTVHPVCPVCERVSPAQCASPEEGQTLYSVLMHPLMTTRDFRRVLVDGTQPLYTAAADPTGELRASQVCAVYHALQFHRVCRWEHAECLPALKGTPGWFVPKELERIRYYFCWRFPLEPIRYTAFLAAHHCLFVLLTLTLNRREGCMLPTRATIVCRVFDRSVGGTVIAEKNNLGEEAEALPCPRYALVPHLNWWTARPDRFAEAFRPSKRMPARLVRDEAPEVFVPAPGS